MRAARPPQPTLCRARGAAYVSLYGSVCQRAWAVSRAPATGNARRLATTSCTPALAKIYLETGQEKNEKLDPVSMAAEAPHHGRRVGWVGTSAGRL
jgi:hypothetical protein